MTASSPVELASRAAETLGVQPDAVVIAPGRVDLLGAHTDYNRFPVLACAIDRHLLIAFRARTDCQCRMVNADPAHPAREFDVSPGIEPAPRGDWSNYARAAAVSIATAVDGPVRGIDAAVASDLPAAGGLSSSSALVTAVGLALAAANDLPIDSARFAEQLADAEQYVGTRGGGMDHATILCSRAGHLLHIEFDPLRPHPREIGEDARFILCHSGVIADKGQAARDLYNLRVAECRAAAVLVAIHDRIEPVHDGRWIRLGDLPDADAPGGPARIADRVENVVPPGPVSLDSVRGQLGSGLDPFAPLGITDPGTLLDPRARARHVLSEAERVRGATALLSPGSDTIATLAEPMGKSHASIRDDFSAGCPPVEKTAALLADHGVAGARMCGAGFGGYLAGLVPAADADAIVRALRAELDADADRVFATDPGPGAVLVE